MKTIYFITGNKGKLAEIENKLQSVEIRVIQKNIGYPEIQTDTLEDVVRFGVEYIKKRFSLPFIIEDAGLFIDALKGFPGVYSKYVFYTIGCKGILKLLSYTDDAQRTAVFKSVYALSEPDKDPILFKGECFGKISMSELGAGGFGYDPIFTPDNETKTFAQMSIKEKNMISHRGKAIEKMIKFLKNKK